MDKNIFLGKLISSLMKQGYIFDEQAIYDYKYQLEEHNRSIAVLGFNFLQGADTVLSVIAGEKSSFTNAKIDISDIIEEEFIKDIENIRLITPYILYKFITSYTNHNVTIIGLMDGDKVKTHEYKRIMKEFDANVLNFRNHRATVLGQKAAVNGLLFFLFSDIDKFVEFEQKHIDDCKITHFWKIVNTLPCGIDISNKNIIKHKGLPKLLHSIIDYKQIEKDLFHE